MKEAGLAVIQASIAAGIGEVRPRQEARQETEFDVEDLARLHEWNGIAFGMRCHAEEIRPGERFYHHAEMNPGGSFVKLHLVALGVVPAGA